MRALSGAKDPEHVADSIIHHPSVRFGLRPKLGSQKAVSVANLVHNGGLRPSCMLSALPHECMQVRTMLLFQKAVSEGGRSMVYECAKLVDKMTDCERAGDHKGAKEVRSDASDGIWPLMASHGLSWPHMASHGFTWPLMASHGL